MSTTIKFTGIVVLALLVLLASLVATINMAVADGPEESLLQGEDVITYDPPGRLPLTDPVRSVIQGTRVDGECVITYTVTVGPNEAPKVARTLAFNPTTCEELIEIGTLNQPGADPEDPPTENASPSGESSGSDTQASALHSASSLPRKTKTLKATWEDFIELDVNWQKTKITWEYDSQNHTVNYLSGQCTWYWLRATGWSADPEKECKEYSQSNGFQHVIEASRGFTNTIFPCSLPGEEPDSEPQLAGAKTRMDNQRIVVNGNGTYTGTVQYSKSGDCAWLLHSETAWE